LQFSQQSFNIAELPKARTVRSLNSVEMASPVHRGIQKCGRLFQTTVLSKFNLSEWPFTSHSNTLHICTRPYCIPNDAGFVSSAADTEVLTNASMPSAVELIFTFCRLMHRSQCCTHYNLIQKSQHILFSNLHSESYLH